jgi:hypothetical protein
VLLGSACVRGPDIAATKIDSGPRVGDNAGVMLAVTTVIVRSTRGNFPLASLLLT